MSINVQNYKMIGLFTLALAVAFIAYWSGIEEAYSRWQFEPNYSHGFLIPLVTLYILWEKRKLIQLESGPPLGIGVGVIFLAVIIFIVGEIAALYLFVQYSFVVVLLGLSLVTVGRATKHTFAPILLLLFAIPLPYFIELLLTAELQLLSSWIGVQVIRLFQIPVFLEGNIIDLGVYQLQVVEACSGLRYLFPLMSLGFIAAYFYQAPFWKRAVLFLSTIPITILMNSFRVGVIGVLVDNWGISMAEGFLHDFEGWVIFMACAFLLFVLVLVMEKLSGSKKSWASLFGVVEAERTMPNVKFPQSERSYKPIIIAIGLLVVALFITKYIDNREEQIPDKKAFIEFPMQFDGWTGHQNRLDERVVEILTPSDYLFANYFDEKQNAVNILIAYYETQRDGVAPHSPRVCIPGGGWEITNISRRVFEDLPYNRAIIQKDNLQQLVYYWFQGRGRVIANEYTSKWFVFQDSLMMNRSDGALIRFVTPVFPGEDIKEADSRIQSLIKQTRPELDKFIAE